jgi:imidazolonepropionase
VHRKPSSKADRAILLTNICQLLTLAGPKGPRRGAALREIGLVEDAAVLCAGGRIVTAGRRVDAERDPWLKRNPKKVRRIDCRGGVLLPGFVDSHTHPAFMEPRLIDFEKRVSGATYQEIAAAGGGIRSSISAVRKASRQELGERVSAALQRMASHGTTTVEAKSGYGLSRESEIKSLEAIHDAAVAWPGTVVPTLLGAHVMPPEFDRAVDREAGRRDYVQQITQILIPEVADTKLAEFVDVFVEVGAFSPEEAEQIFAAAHEEGLGIRAHVGQLTALPPGWLATMLRRFPLASVDHADHLSDEDIAVLARHDTVATLLPAVNCFLGLPHYAPARKLIDAGVAVALATDFNPGTSPTPSMPQVLSLACTHMKMSPAEAIVAATINGAHALRLAERKGSIEAGKDADLALFAVKDYREIAYWFGTNLCALTLCAGVPIQPES